MKLPLLTLFLMLSNQIFATTFVVNNLNDTGSGSLRQAILNANADNSPSTGGDDHIIDLSGMAGTIVLTSSITINQHMSITGPAAGGLTVSGNNSTNIFVITGTAWTITIDNLTIANASKSNGGAGIENAAKLYIHNCTFANNTTTSTGQGAAIWSGGAAELYIYNSTFKNNAASNTGGAIANYGTMDLINCTFSGNSSSGGGAVIDYGYSAAKNLTITNNSPNGWTAANGGGTVLTNSVIVGNANSDVYGDLTGVVCLFGTTEGGTISGSMNTTGVAAASIFGANVLANNGGITETIAILNPSAAVDGGYMYSGVQNTDQRGFARVGNPDLGAFEHPEPLSVIASEFSSSMKILSNPGNGLFIIEFASPTLEKIDFVVSDLRGRKLLQTSSELNAQSLKIDLQQYASGNYILTAISGKRSAVKQLIKQ
jgi:hypothetical protein